MDIFEKIKLCQRFYDLIGIECSDLASFYKRISAIDTFVRTSSFCLDVKHAAFSPVKIQKVVVKGEIKLPKEMLPGIHLYPFVIPVYQTFNSGRICLAFQALKKVI